jgi:hypothetical protein
MLGHGRHVPCPDKAASPPNKRADPPFSRVTSRANGAPRRATRPTGCAQP